MNLSVWCLLMYYGFFIVTAPANAIPKVRLKNPNEQDIYLTITDNDNKLIVNITWLIRPPDACKTFEVQLTSEGDIKKHESSTPEAVFDNLERDKLYSAVVQVSTRMMTDMLTTSNLQFRTPAMRTGGQIQPMKEFTETTNDVADKYIAVFLSGEKCALVVYDSSTAYTEGYTIEGTNACPNEKPYIVAHSELIVVKSNENGKTTVTTTIPTSLFATFTDTPKMAVFGVVNKQPKCLFPAQFFYIITSTTFHYMKISWIIRPPPSHPDFIKNISVRLGDKEKIVLSQNEDTEIKNTFNKAQLMEAQKDNRRGFLFDLTSDIYVWTDATVHVSTNDDNEGVEVSAPLSITDPYELEYARITSVGTDFISFAWGDPVSSYYKPMFFEVIAADEAFGFPDHKVMVEPSVRNWTIRGLLPYHEYYTHVIVHYANNFSWRMGITYTWTLQAAPGPVRNLQCQPVTKTGGSEHICTWEPPEYMNGKLIHYVITVKDERAVTHTTQDTTITFTEFSLRFPSHFFVTVAAETVSVGPVASQTEELTIVPYPTETANVIGSHLFSPPPDSIEIDTHTQRKLFVNMEAIKQNHFSPINKLIVLVSEGLLNGIGEENLPTYKDYVSNDTITYYGVNIYEADGWYLRPLKNIVVTLGEDVGEIQPGHKFNGPLRMGTNYSTCIRICTNEGCSDSDAMSFETSGKTTITTTEPPLSGTSEGLSGGATAGIVIACIVGTLLVVFLVLFMLKRKRRKSNEQMICDLAAEHAGPVSVDTTSVNLQQAVPQPGNEIGIHL